MSGKFYALYEDHRHVLVFDSKEERDTYVREEKIVHPDCIRASWEKAKQLIGDKKPVYDKGFGCMVVVV